MKTKAKINSYVENEKFSESVNQKIPAQRTVTIAREEERGGNEDRDLIQHASTKPTVIVNHS